MDALSIGEVARRTGVKASALRFYEQKGLIASIRTAGNQRCYTRDAIRRVSFIRAAQRASRSLDRCALYNPGDAASRFRSGPRRPTQEHEEEL